MCAELCLCPVVPFGFEDAASAYDDDWLFSFFSETATIGHISSFEILRFLGFTVHFQYFLLFHLIFKALARGSIFDLRAI
jgi:hypothetical protein